MGHTARKNACGQFYFQKKNLIEFECSSLKIKANKVAKYSLQSIHNLGLLFKQI